MSDLSFPRAFLDFVNSFIYVQFAWVFSQKKEKKKKKHKNHQNNNKTKKNKPKRKPKKASKKSTNHTWNKSIGAEHWLSKYICVFIW